MSTITLTEQGSTPSTPEAGKQKLYVASDGLHLVDDAGSDSSVPSTDSRGFRFLVGPDASDPYPDLDSAITAATGTADTIYVKATSTPYAAPTVAIPDKMRFIGLSGHGNKLSDVNTGFLPAATGVVSDAPIVTGPVDIDTGTYVTFRNMVLTLGGANSSPAVDMNTGSFAAFENCLLRPADLLAASTSPLLVNPAGSAVLTMDGTTCTNDAFPIIGATAWTSFLFLRSEFIGSDLVGSTIAVPMTATRCDFRSLTTVSNSTFTADYCQFPDLDLSAGGTSTLKFCTTEAIDSSAGTATDIDLSHSEVAGTITLGVTGSDITARNSQLLDLVIGNDTPTILIENSSVGALTCTGTGGTQEYRNCKVTSGSITGTIGTELYNCMIDTTFSYPTGGAGGADLQARNTTFEGTLTFEEATTAALHNCSLADVVHSDAGNDLTFKSCKGGTFTDTVGSISSLVLEPSPGSGFDAFTGTEPESAFGFTTVSSSPYEIVPRDRTIAVDTSVARTINLDEVVADLWPGRRVVIFDATGGAGANTITIASTAPVLVNGTNITSAYGRVEVIYDGTSWIQTSYGP